VAEATETAFTTFVADSFTQRNFVADFLQAKCDFRQNCRFAFLSPPPPSGGGGLGATYDIILGSLESA